LKNQNLKIDTQKNDKFCIEIVVGNGCMVSCQSIHILHEKVFCIISFESFLKTLGGFGGKRDPPSPQKKITLGGGYCRSTLHIRKILEKKNPGEHVTDFFRQRKFLIEKF